MNCLMKARALPTDACDRKHYHDDDDDDDDDDDEDEDDDDDDDFDVRWFNVHLEAGLA